MEPATTRNSAELISEPMPESGTESLSCSTRAEIVLGGGEPAPFLLGLTEGKSPAPASLASPQPQAVPIGDGIATDSRSFDVTLALMILLFVLPLMAICAIAVAFSSRGPLLFKHTRIGRGGREFTCLKFRTMSQNADLEMRRILSESSETQEEWAAAYKLRCDPRVTPAGRILRRYCLDELPQLFNVLKGDMSIVGPRPIVADEVHRYGRYFADYCKVKPGLTGLWQVSGMHSLSYQERVLIDAAYVNSKSLRMDIKIILKTVPIVIFGENC